MNTNTASGPSIGTFGPFFIPKDGGIPRGTLVHGDYYFSVHFQNAALIAHGGWWNNSKFAVGTMDVSTTVGQKSLHGTNFTFQQDIGNGVHGDNAGQNHSVIEMTPARMNSVTLHFQILVTNKQPVTDLLKLISGNAFTTAFSLAPGVSSVVSAVSGLVPSVLGLFGFDEPAQQTLLDREFDFDLQQQSLGDGHYVILAAHGINSELAQPLQDSDFTVQGSQVLLKGHPIAEASYLLIECAVRDNLQDSLGDSAEPWVLQYNQAMTTLDDISGGATDPGSINSSLQTVLKQLYAVEQLQQQDTTFTQKDQRFFLGKLRTYYVSVRGQHPGADPQV